MFKNIKVFLLISFFISIAHGAFAFDDGFNAKGKEITTYFTIYYSDEADLSRFEKSIYLPSSQTVLYGGGSGVGMVDMLFLRVSDILDMKVPNFSGKIKICSDHQQLNEAYNNLFGKSLSASSFYVFALKTIYIDAQTVNAAILGHEMAHAVISDYFTVTPPIKMQEILGGYVEYQLKKESQ